jgi:hypothetical protein
VKVRRQEARQGPISGQYELRDPPFDVCRDRTEKKSTATIGVPHILDDRVRDIVVDDTIYL